MATHLIRLRKAWECEDATSNPQATRRLDLPLSGSSVDSLPTRARLIRTFATPRMAAGQEFLSIRLVGVEGLRTVLLNGQPVPVPEHCPDVFEIEVAEPRSRNRLVLEVDFGPASRDAQADYNLWGEVALVIRSHQSE